MFNSILRLFAKEDKTYFLFTFCIIWHKSYTNRQHVTARWVVMLDAPFGKVISHKKISGKWIVKNKSDEYTINEGDYENTRDMHHVLLRDEENRYFPRKETENKAFRIMREKIREKLYRNQRDLGVCRLAKDYQRLFIQEDYFYVPFF